MPLIIAVVKHTVAVVFVYTEGDLESQATLQLHDCQMWLLFIDLLLLQNIDSYLKMINVNKKIQDTLKWDLLSSVICYWMLATQNCTGLLTICAEHHIFLWSLGGKGFGAALHTSSPPISCFSLRFISGTAYHVDTSDQEQQQCHGDHRERHAHLTRNCITESREINVLLSSISLLCWNRLILA